MRPPGSGSFRLLILAALAGAATAQQPLRVGMPSPHPMGYRDAAGIPHGFMIDALAEAARRAGLTLEWEPPGDPDRNNDALRRGRLDLITGIDSAERRRDFFVTPPWWSSELVLLLPAASPIRQEAELAGKRLAIPRGAGHDIEHRYPSSQLVSVGSAVAAADAVCSGAADAAVIGGMYVRELLLAASPPCRGAGLRILDARLPVNYVLIARPAMANAARALKSALDSITADGTLAAIAARYPPVSTPQATRLAELLRLGYERRLLGISAAAAALLIVVAAIFAVTQAAARRRLRDANVRLQRDLEARARAEAALRDSEARFRALFESAPIAVVAFDRAGVIVFANRASCEIFGRDTLIGVDYRSLVRGKDTGVRADAAEFPLEVRLGGVDTADGLTLAFITDISERVTLQQQFLQSQKLESVGQLAGGVAHDFNNLLTVISGYAHMGLEDLAPNDASRDAFREIADAASRAAALTGQLLAFSRRQRATPRVISLNELLRNVEKMLRRLIGEHIELIVIEGEIPTVLADPGQIEQVVMNLAVNARDAMPDGGRLTISTASQRGGQAAALRVADTGSGMTAEVQAHIFEPFFTTKEQGKGTGLGLSTVYGIVKQAAGEVLVESEPGRGTTFTVVLPAAGEPLQTAAEKEGAAPASGAETVLVAEDEPGVRKFVSAVLASRGYRVLEASTGREALDVAARYDGPIHLLVSDIVMPELGGMELAVQLRERRPDLAILHMSGYSDHLPALDDEALLQKPFSATTLLRRVREVLDGS
jgi:signal transduction histidine kinase